MLAALPTGRADHIVYFGTPEVAVEPLRAIVKAGFTVDLVITGVDKRRGRGSQTSPCPVKQAALEMGLTVSHNIDDVVKLSARLSEKLTENTTTKTQSNTVGVVVAYGHIIASSVLQIIPMINIHYSLLPRWRGAAPVERALLAGDEMTGVCIMKVVEQLDAGDILASVSTPIASNDTVTTLRERLGDLAIPLLVQVLTEGPSNAEAQLGDVVIASKITSNDLRIDWSQDALRAARQVRVGGAFTMMLNKRLKIHSLNICAPPTSWSTSAATDTSGSVRVVDGRVLVDCAHGCVELIEVQPEGKSRLGALDWSLGARLDANSRFDS
jgi:methionyl-tRNA formyltransferase